MPFAGGGVPDTPADFLVVEEWSTSDRLQREIEDAGLGFFVWTVNEDNIRTYLRRDAGIITDIQSRRSTPQANPRRRRTRRDTLVDALSSFVVEIVPGLAQRRRAAAQPDLLPARDHVDDLIDDPRCQLEQDPAVGPGLVRVPAIGTTQVDDGWPRP